MLQRNDCLQTAPRKKHKSVIITGLRDTWLKIIKSRKLDQGRKERNRHRKNLRSKFW